MNRAQAFRQPRLLQLKRDAIHSPRKAASAAWPSGSRLRTNFFQDPLYLFAEKDLSRITGTELKFGDLSPEAQAARLLHCRHLGIISLRRLAEDAGLPVERIELLMCRGLSTLIARGYPAEELCETYRVTPEQLSRASIVPAFSSIFKPLAASR